MGEERTQTSQREESAREEPKHDAVTKHRRRIFYRSFWSEHPVAILGAIVATVLIGPVTNFPGGQRKDLWYVVAGLIVWLLLVAFWFIDGVRKLQVPTDDELEGQYRDRVERHLSSVDARLRSAEEELTKQRPKRLTAQQKSAITAVMSQFPGQACNVEVHSLHNDTLMLGQDLHDAIRVAGCTSTLSGSSSWMPNFCVRVHVHSSYLTVGIPGTGHLGEVPKSFRAMIDCLESLGLSDRGLVNIDDAVPIGEIRLRVGAAKDPG